MDEFRLLIGLAVLALYGRWSWVEGWRAGVLAVGAEIIEEQNDEDDDT